MRIIEKKNVAILSKYKSEQFFLNISLNWVYVTSPRQPIVLAKCDTGNTVSMMFKRRHTICHRGNEYKRNTCRLMMASFTKKIDLRTLCSIQNAYGCALLMSFKSFSPAQLCM